MDYCWKCGGPMSKNSRERVCMSCGRTVQRHKNKTSSYDDSSSSIGGGILGVVLGLGLFGLAIASTKKSRRKNDVAILDPEDYSDYSVSLENTEKKQKGGAWVRKHRKGILVCILALILSVTFLVVHLEIKLLIPLGHNSSSLEGLKYTEVIQMLKEAGFTNIHSKEISDLTISRENEENIVTEVNLMHTSVFDKNEQYPSNLRITVVYHTVELYTPPLTSKDAKGMNYEEVVSEFKNIGFTNISFEVKYDIIAKWIYDDGEVKSVTINGNSKYDYYDEYRLDAEIVITYHTLLSNKPE